ncbi:dTDP-glucose 4,6-dehydratase [Spirochaetia bacterium]|nr:dTDP-glucose 4,6-dehydratase [Spirochaetia bacterium]
MFINHKFYQDDVSNIAAHNIDWVKLQNKSILITGSTGLIGTFLIDVLMYRNHTYNDNIAIYAVGRNKEKALARFGDYIHSSNFIFIQQDMQMPVEVNKNVDYIIHGASNTHPIAYATDPVNTILLTIIGTRNILDFAAMHKVKRTIFLSTVEIYGENRGDTEKFVEEYCGYIDCNTLRAGYPEGKRAAEALCQAYINKNAMDIVIARCCRVYGPTMGDDDSKVIAQFLRSACENKNIALKSKGEQQYSYCYVADICSALLTLLFGGENGEAYNIANQDDNKTLLQIAKIISKYIHKDIRFEIPPIEEAAGYSKAMKALLDCEKLQLLGWRPHYSIEDGLIRTLDILRS